MCNKRSVDRMRYITAYLPIPLFFIIVGAGMSAWYFYGDGTSLQHDIPTDKPRQRIIIWYKIRRIITNITTSPSLPDLFELKAKINISTLTLLHDAGADFTAVDSKGRTFLANAVWSHQSVAVLSKLIEYGIDYKRLDNQDMSLLHAAAYIGNAEALAYLATKEGLDINGKDDFGRTPLHYVGHDNYHEEKPLAVTRILLAFGADKSIGDEWGDRPYDIVKHEILPDKEKVLKLLV